MTSSPPTREQPDSPPGPAPVVSVCIANWNCRELLRNCLASLYNNPQGVSLEVIVVDNDSADGAPDMVEREFPQAILVRNPGNFGFSRANNQALHLARGQYVFFLNNDTLVPAGTLKILVDYLETHPEAGMVGPRFRDGQGDFQVSYRPRPTVSTFLHQTALLRWTGLLRRAYQKYRRQSFDPYTTRPVEILMGAAVLLDRRRFLAWGGWDEDFHFGGEDMELSYRINRQAQVVYHPQAEITHFGRASTRQNIRFASTKIAVGFAQYFRKTGATKLGLFLYKLVLTLDAPVQCFVKGIQFLVRRLIGQRQKAEQSLNVIRGLTPFLFRGLVPFWRA